MSGVNIQEALENFSTPVISQEELAARRGYTEKVDKPKSIDHEPFFIDKAKSRVVACMVGFAILAGGAALHKAASGESEYEQATEACVSKLVGREVDLVEGPDGGTLQHPASVFDEQAACERWNNDPALARLHLRHIPLDVNK